MATNEKSLFNDQFFDQLKVAVLSANLNTNLIPFLIYQGSENSRLEWLREKGVTIVFHELTIYTQIKEYILSNNFDHKMIDIRTGAYLRSEIPLAMDKYDMQDRYIFYTDCDVVFLKNPEIENYKPKYLAMSSGSVMGGYTKYKILGRKHFNSGVMLMNVHRLRREHDAFINFVLNNGGGARRPKLKFMQKNLFMSDQVAYNLFYKGKIKELGRIYNWRPRMGINQDATIIHFNGLKWTQWDDFLKGLLPPDQMDKFSRLVNVNMNAYEYYVGLARNILESEKNDDL